MGRLDLGRRGEDDAPMGFGTALGWPELYVIGDRQAAAREGGYRRSVDVRIQRKLRPGSSVPGMAPSRWVARCPGRRTNS